MNIYRYEEAFGAADKTSRAMRQAMKQWQALYYGAADREEDPCQRIAYTVVNKITKTVFGEYRATAPDPAAQAVVAALDKLRKEAVQLALMGGECYIKPCPEAAGFDFTLIPRANVLVFARDPAGRPVDVGLVEKSTLGKYYYTLLERRRVDEKGFLSIENRLYRSLTGENLGSKAALNAHPAYQELPERYTYPVPLGSVGLVRMKTPMVNCVDGSPDGVAVYAPAAALIRNIDRNEAQLCGEFQRGESRVILSADLLGKEGLQDHLFVGLDEDPDRVGITVFAPQLRQQSFLERKQEYLRNVESIIGLKRGMLSDANVEERTATEITSSAGDFNLTVIDFQSMWQEAVADTVALCAKLSRLYRLETPEDLTVHMDWGNGILYDEDKTWADYLEMVRAGLIKPEIALGWRFGMATDTPEDLEAIRKKWMPEMEVTQ